MGGNHQVVWNSSTDAVFGNNQSCTYAELQTVNTQLVVENNLVTVRGCDMFKFSNIGDGLNQVFWVNSSEHAIVFGSPNVQEIYFQTKNNYIGLADLISKL